MKMETLKLVRKFNGQSPRELRDTLLTILNERLTNLPQRSHIKGKQKREAYASGEREALESFKSFLEEIEFTE
jgi:hypothetical protein